MFTYSHFYSHNDFTDLTMYQFGYSECRPGSMPGYLIYKHYLFHYIFAGKGVLYSEDGDGNVQSFPAEAGQGFMIFPGCRSNYIADKEEPWHYGWVEFDGLKAEELVKQAKFSVSHPIFISKEESEGKRMGDALKFIIMNPNNPPMELIAHLYLFMNSLVRATDSVKPVFKENVCDFYVQEAIAYINRNYPKDLSIYDIAEHCNIHRSYFSRIFKSVMGISPQDFLIQRRMEIACELLKTTNRSIGEIGAMVGYPNQLNFSRAFKREIGVAPREFRK